MNCYNIESNKLLEFKLIYFAHQVYPEIMHNKNILYEYDSENWKWLSYDKYFRVFNRRNSAYLTKSKISFKNSGKKKIPEEVDSWVMDSHRYNHSS